MTDAPARVSIAEWRSRRRQLLAAGLREPPYGGPLDRHVDDGDRRLARLLFDNSAASLRLWNFVLTEEDRLHAARAAGCRIVGAMKDLGTVPVMVFSLENVVAFYPDGAWWIPCLMEQSAGLLSVADRLGLNESFCPVRAMPGAFVTGEHFPRPDLLTCSVGATCDDFSAIAQRLEGLGYPILWWEMPHRRRPDPDEKPVALPGGLFAPAGQVAFVSGELGRVRKAIEDLAGRRLDDAALAAGIRRANRVRRLLAGLRELGFTTAVCPLPALEMLLAEMLAIHFCSDRAECIRVLEELLAEVRTRVRCGAGVLPREAVRVFWVNPVADLRVMNLLEDCGGRLCGTDFMFCHALDAIPEDVPPMEALARAAIADPMVGPSADRAERICADVRHFGAEAVVVSRIPGASHCATEGDVIARIVRDKLGIPVVEIEVPPISDAIRPGLQTRLEALVETVREQRR